MRWATIRKDAPPRTAPNLGDYDEECAGFSWSEARAWLEGLPGGRGLNIAHEAVDRHAASTRAAAVALRCVARDGSVTRVTYADLSRSTARFANVLRALGIGHGDRVVTLLGRCAEPAACGRSMGSSRPFLRVRRPRRRARPTEPWTSDC
ncbi:AMP-binding protein [Streptomyces gelaticus]